MNEILYQVVAVDSDLIKNYPTKVVCISQNENMDNGVIYNDYDSKNHRYIKTYVSDNFNIFDKHKEQEEKIYNLQSKIDKANEILNRPQFEYDNIPCNCEEDIKELKDVLKEEKTDEETVQSWRYS